MPDASAFTDYHRTYLNFQITLVFLKNPPDSYQQPGVDLVRRLDAIQADVNSGSLGNQYHFETAVLKLSNAAYDGHLSVEFIDQNIFRFGPGIDLRLVSIAKSQLDIPRVYVQSKSAVTP